MVSEWIEGVVDARARESSPRVISLGDDFGAVVVQGGGIKVELNSSGSVAVYTNGDVKVRPAVNDDAQPQSTWTQRFSRGCQIAND